MYAHVPELGWTAEQVREARSRAVSVDVAPGPGGSRISEPTTVFRGLVPEGIARVVALYPSSQLVAHVDPPIRGKRYHWPLKANRGCWVFHDGSWQQLAIGQAYAMDPTQWHGAVNWGNDVRLHVMVETED